MRTRWRRSGSTPRCWGRDRRPRRRAPALVSSIISEVDRLTEITETYLRFARLPRPSWCARSGALVTGSWSSPAPSCRRPASRCSGGGARCPGGRRRGAAAPGAAQLVRNAREASPRRGRRLRSPWGRGREVRCARGLRARHRHRPPGKIFDSVLLHQGAGHGPLAWRSSSRSSPSTAGASTGEQRPGGDRRSSSRCRRRPAADGREAAVSAVPPRPSPASGERETLALVL